MRIFSPGPGLLEQHPRQHGSPRKRQGRENTHVHLGTQPIKIRSQDSLSLISFPMLNASASFPSSTLDFPAVLFSSALASPPNHQISIGSECGPLSQSSLLFTGLGKQEDPGFFLAGRQRDDS